MLNFETQHPLRKRAKSLRHFLALAATHQMRRQRRRSPCFQFAVEISHHFFGVKRVLCISFHKIPRP